MGGDVSPFEWIVPPVALAHQSIKTTIDKGVPALTKASKSILGVDDPSQPAQAPTLGTPIVTNPAQTAEADDLARQRAIRARQGLGESTRASDQLTGTLG